MKKSKKKLNIISAIKGAFSLTKILLNMKENLKKSPITTIAGAIMALIPILSSLGIELPAEWLPYILSIAAVLLGLSGDPDKIALSKDILEDVINEDEKPEALLSSQESAKIRNRKRKKVTK